MITERRVRRPFGMHGGGEGANGVNYWAQRREDGTYKWLQLGPRGLTPMETGDRCVLWTPGGGGWGTPDAEPSAVNGVAAAVSNGVCKLTNGVQNAVESVVDKLKQDAAVA